MTRYTYTKLYAKYYTELRRPEALRYQEFRLHALAGSGGALAVNGQSSDYAVLDGGRLSQYYLDLFTWEE